MLKQTIWKFSATVAAVTLAASPAAARKASSLADLNGQNAASAEYQLQARGLKYVDGRKGNYGESYSYWWDSNGNDCIVAEVSDGRVMTINDASNKDCHHDGGNAGAAVAAVAGVALLGALIAHKSDHHDDKKHYENQAHEREYDRGYSDGLHHTAYHNYDNSRYYTQGYTAGVQQRNNNTRNHHGYGGYTTKAAFTDLRGDRASSADSAMRQRGFVNVDGFKSGTTSYTIWNRPASQQCIQVAVANGRVSSAVDIHTHPSCR